ncbi:hypothetical protein PVAP13_8KG252733 [Panicum virgatum]|uniref:Uncharacterized protein n=1 Tax=Panicum virgatum TaxID=38727 RepID=A0A8T0PNP4_PANVG|nr:hypothetical protein PVAP13_8KG252733 [Panicum virgatum]
MAHGSWEERIAAIGRNAESTGDRNISLPAVDFFPSVFILRATPLLPFPLHTVSPSLPSGSRAWRPIWICILSSVPGPSRRPMAAEPRSAAAAHPSPSKPTFPEPPSSGQPLAAAGSRHNSAQSQIQSPQEPPVHASASATACHHLKSIVVGSIVLSDAPTEAANQPSAAPTKRVRRRRGAVRRRSPPAPPPDAVFFFAYNFF